jgi:hypothetical protein
VNPWHLEPLPHAEHMKEKRKAHCIRGHDMSVHAGTQPNGKRYCRRCATERTTERRIRIRDKNATAVT